MTDYDASDLVAMWQFQDNLENHARVLLKHGVELGALAMVLELSKLMLAKGITQIDNDDLQEAKDRATIVASKELEKRMNRARGTQAAEE
jgi:hypothetical protein